MRSPVSTSEIAAAVAQLPPVSAVLQRILHVLQDPNAPLENVARLVRAETGLAAQVVRMANSAYFGQPERASSIDEAIQRLGVAEVNRLVTMLGSQHLFLRPLRAYGFSAETLWSHTLTVAVCAETLATYAGVDRHNAHLAGIMHPVGMLALERMAEERKLPARAPEIPLGEWEMANFGQENSAIAAQVLREWQFPEALAAVVAQRYEPVATGEASSPSHLLHLASLLAERIGGELPGERGRFRTSVTYLAAAGVPWDAFSEAEVESRQNLERTRALLQVGT